MKKRFYIKTLLLIASVFSVSFTAKAETIHLVLSHYLPTSQGLHKDFLEPWARELEARTNGKVEVEVQPGGTALGSITKQWDQVIDEITDIGFGLHGIPRGRFHCTAAIELPFLTDNVSEANEKLWGAFPQYLGDEHSEVKVLALMAHDPGVLAVKGREINSPDDLKGLRIRVPSPFIAAMMEDLGAVPVSMPPGQVYEGLLQGSLDGVVLPWAGMREFRITEVVDFAVEIGAYTTPFYFVMNKDRYESLPEDVQQAIDDISGDTLVEKFPGWWTSWGQGGADEIISKGGKVVTAENAQRQVWIDRVAQTRANLEAQLIKDCAHGEALLESLKK